MAKWIVKGAAVPKATGAYSPGLVVGNVCFISGQSPVNPRTGELVQGDIAAQVRQALTNFMAVLDAASFLPEDLAYVQVALVDISDWPVVNTIYRDRLKSGTMPARLITGGAQLLPVGARIEIQGIAARE